MTGALIRRKNQHRQWWKARNRGRTWRTAEEEVALSPLPSACSSVSPSLPCSAGRHSAELIPCVLKPMLLGCHMTQERRTVRCPAALSLAKAQDTTEAGPPAVSHSARGDPAFVTCVYPALPASTAFRVPKRKLSSSPGSPVLISGKRGLVCH